MSPTAYYCWLYERPVMWLGLKKLRPRPDQNFPLGVALLIPLIVAGIPLGAFALFTQGKLPNILVLILGIMLFTCVVFHMGFTVLAWNQRAARLRAAGGEPPPPARPPWFVILFLGPIYLLLIGLVTPMAALTTMENVRGALRWREVRTQLTAQGEKLDILELVGPGVPDADNAASLPMFAKLFDYGRSTIVVDGREIPQTRWAETNAMRRFEVFRLPDDFLPKRAKNDRHPSSLAEWAGAFQGAISNNLEKAEHRRRNSEGLPSYVAAPADAAPATVVLTALEVGAADIGPVCEASQRPRARFPIHYEDGFNALLPHLAYLKSMQRYLALRVQARLELGQVDAAYSDTLCALHVAELAREEPLLIGQLVRFAQAAIVTQSIWHGIAGHRWNDAQLREFQRLLDQPNFPAGVARAMEGERACSLSMLERWATNPRRLLRESGEMGLVDTDDSGGQAVNMQGVGVFLMPRGWIRQNQAAIATYLQQTVEMSRQLATNPPNGNWGLALQDGTDKLEHDLRRHLTHVTAYNALVKQLAPALGRAIEKGVRAHVINRCASIGCALERYRLKHGAYPEKLDALVPDFLPAVPQDPMDGQPLRYEKTDDGLFLLWSVGADGFDDGGISQSQQRTGKTPAGGDWTWPN